LNRTMKQHSVGEKLRGSERIEERKHDAEVCVYVCVSVGE
jgi:hypothetical protein